MTVSQRLRDAELEQKLASVQVECAKLAEEIASLRQELLSLRDNDRLRVEMVFRDYWRQRPNAEPDGPFCRSEKFSRQRSAALRIDQHLRTTLS